MGYTTDSLVIETRTIKCGKCFKVDEDGVFRGNAFDTNDTIAECDRYSGNCQLAPVYGVEDPIIDVVKKCWEQTTIILQLLCKNMKNVVEVRAYQWNPQAKTYNKKWISVRTTMSTYWLCFDRMYTAEVERGLVANTIYGLIQMYRDIDDTHTEGPNSKILGASKYRYSTWKIFYPNTFESNSVSIKEWCQENIEEVDLKTCNLQCKEKKIYLQKAYNPNLTVTSRPEEIATQFFMFIKCCEEI